MLLLLLLEAQALRGVRIDAVPFASALSLSLSLSLSLFSLFSLCEACELNSLEKARKSVVAKIQLSNKLTRLTYVNRIKAWAICFDGILNKSNIKDAICIEMHEASQESITNLYYPYQLDEHKVIFSEPIFEKE